MFACHQPLYPGASPAAPISDAGQARTTIDTNEPGHFIGGFASVTLHVDTFGGVPCYRAQTNGATCYRSERGREPRRFMRSQIYGRALSRTLRTIRSLTPQRPERAAQPETSPKPLHHSNSKTAQATLTNPKYSQGATQCQPPHFPSRCHIKS
jgi:hypothetical protein